MLCVFIGAASVCVIALCKVARMRRHGGWGRHGHHHCRERWDHDDDGDGFSPWEGRGGGGFFWLRSFFARLDTTPGQEKAIKAVLSDLRAKGRAVKDDARGMRGDLATALRGESIDAETLGTVASRASGAVDALRDASIGAVLKIHEVLDERQRGLLADLLESGPRAWRWRGRGGPYRSASRPLET